jgi:hypothetical protein
LTCWHSLNTYLYLLDPKQPLECRWPPQIAATTPLRDTVRPAKAAAKSAPSDREVAYTARADSGTINITIKIGRTE